MFYKALGFITWKALKVYVGQKLPSRPVLVGGAAGAVIVGVVVAASATKREELTGS
jgi:hypothetical protein